MQISYHSALTKIKKLKKKKKKKKKKLIFVLPDMPDICWNARNQLVFKSIQNIYISIPMYAPIRYISAIPTGIVCYWPPCQQGNSTSSLIEHIDNVLIKGVHELDWVGFGCFSI